MSKRTNSENTRSDGSGWVSCRIVTPTRSLQTASTPNLQVTSRSTSKLVQEILSWRPAQQPPFSSRQTLQGSRPRPTLPRITVKEGLEVTQELPSNPELPVPKRTADSTRTPLSYRSYIRSYRFRACDTSAVKLTVRERVRPRTLILTKYVNNLFNQP